MLIIIAKIIVGLVCMVQFWVGIAMSMSQEKTAPIYMLTSALSLIAITLLLL